MDNNDNVYGYIYCMSNKGYQKNVFKIGVTNIDPLIRTTQLYTSGVIHPFVLEFAKKVKLPNEKEKIITIILEEHGYRVNPHKKFYKCPMSDIYNLFNCVKGTWYTETRNLNRNMKNVFYHGQIISHRTKYNGISSQWIGTYNRERNVILYDNFEYPSMNLFTSDHYIASRPDRTSSNNAWAECRCRTINGEWISTMDLPNI